MTTSKSSRFDGQKIARCFSWTAQNVVTYRRHNRGRASNPLRLKDDLVSRI